MANRLKMADQAAIIALWQRGWSQRRIARETGFDRSTVARYVRLARAGWCPEVPAADHPEPAISTPGSSARDGPDATSTVNSNPAISTAGSEGGPATVAGRQSLCESVREIIEPKLAAGLSAQRIWQDLTTEHGFAGSYQSVKRFCRRMRNRLPLPFRRMECEPGAEAQVDFGTGAPVVIPDGEPLPYGVKTRRRKTHVFRIVLSHSLNADRSPHPGGTEDGAGSKPVEPTRHEQSVTAAPGTGKSHIVQALGYQTIKAGMTVFYRSIFDVVRDFLHDEAFEGHDKVLAKYLKPDLVIIDDMGSTEAATEAVRGVPVRDYHAPTRSALDDDDVEPTLGGLGEAHRRCPGGHGDPGSIPRTCRGDHGDGQELSTAEQARFQGE